MNPVSKTEIENIRSDFIKFCALGHTELKALWLTVSGRGYLDIIGSSPDSIMVFRRSDKKFIIATYPLKEVEQIKTKREIHSVKFHTDTSNIKLSTLIV